MDAKKFGAFLAQRRRELDMTQAQLAGRLNVTDKAVSRWERGTGFPDITTLEPLAQALEVTLLELMRSERLEAPVEQNAADDAISETLELARLQRLLRRQVIIRILLIALAGCVALVTGVYMKYGWAMNVGAIGGSDAPTAIWVVGKPVFGVELTSALILIGAALMLLALVLAVKNRR